MHFRKQSLNSIKINCLIWQINKLKMERDHNERSVQYYLQRKVLSKNSSLSNYTNFILSIAFVGLQ